MPAAHSTLAHEEDSVEDRGRVSLGYASELKLSLFGGGRERVRAP